MKKYSKITGLLIAGLFVFSTIANAETQEQYRARSQEEVYRRSNDAYSPNNKELRDSLNNIYLDASNTWSGWEGSLGDKWQAFKDSLVGKVDNTSDKVQDSFYDTISDFRGYVKSVQDKGHDYTDDAKKKAGDLINNLKSSYENYKAATKSKYDEWINSSKGKIEEGAADAKDKSHQAYEDAKAKYHQSKSDFVHGIQSLTEELSAKKQSNNASVGDHINNSYESLKHGMKHLFEDASKTWADFKDKHGAKWHEQNENGQSPAEDYQTTINDFQHYQKAFEETGDKHTEGVRARIGKLLDNLKEKYDALKERTVGRVESATNGTSLKSAALDEYNQAFDEFTQYKSKLYNEMSYLSGNTSKEDYYNSWKNEIAGLYKDASDTIASWKELLGDKWNNVTAGSDEGQSDANADKPEEFQDTIKDFLKYEQVFEDTKAQNTYTDEARIRLSELTDELQEKYREYKNAAINKWKDLTSRDENGAKIEDNKSLQVYNQAKIGYYKSKQRLQDEVDYLTGKISKEDYDTRARNYEGAGHNKAINAVKNAWRSLKDKFEAGTEKSAQKVHVNDEM